MRKFGTKLLLAVTAILLAGCPGNGSRMQFEGGGSYNNILRAGNGAEPEGLDPHIVTGIPEHHILLTLYEGLVNLDPKTLDPIPGVAESWEVSDDGLVYTFHLRQEAKWSNGDPVTSQDFLYAWRRILDPQLGGQYAYMLYCMKNARPFNEGSLTDFAQVGAAAPDDHTVVVTLEAPTPYFMTLHIHYTWFPIHRPTIEKFDAYYDRSSPWTRPGNLVSNGAFTLVSWEPDRTLKVARSETYWDRANVKLDGVWFYPVDERQTEERMFRAGELDYTESVPSHKVPGYRRDHPELIHIDPWLGTYYYELNTRRPPLDNAKLRQALSFAIDRKSIVDNITLGGQLPGYYFTPPGMLGYEPKPYAQYDPAKAKRLLAEAGYPDGKGVPPLQILYNTDEDHRKIAEAIQSMWKETLGINAELQNQDWKVYLDARDEGNFTVARAGWIGDFVDPVNFLECFTTGNGNNHTGWGDPRYDEYVETARYSNDLDERNALYDQAEELLLTEYPILPVYIYTRVYLMDPAVKGRYHNLMDYTLFKSLWLERSAVE